MPLTLALALLEEAALRAESPVSLSNIAAVDSWQISTWPPFGVLVPVVCDSDDCPLASDGIDGIEGVILGKPITPALSTST
jgi:hypothetical protein